MVTGMARYREQSFEGVVGCGPAKIGPAAFDNCSFTDICFGLEGFPSPEILDCHFAQSVFAQMNVDGIVLRRCSFDGVKTPGFNVARGLMLDACILRGKIGSVGIQQARTPTGRQAAIAFYNSVHVALDISEMRPTGGVGLTGVPGRLIRRDPKVQALVRVSEIVARFGSPVGVDSHEWCRSIEAVLGAGLSGILPEVHFAARYGSVEDIILAARTGAPRAKWEEDVRFLRRCRDLGLLELED